MARATGDRANPADRGRLASRRNAPDVPRGERTRVGLELGADDYLPKPFEPRELLARLRAVLRRGKRAATGQKASLRFGRLEIDEGGRIATLDGTRCDITAHQFELLRILAENAGRVLSREVLMERLRGEELGAFDRSIDVHISRLRAAIEDDGENGDDGDSNPAQDLHGDDLCAISGRL